MDYDLNDETTNGLNILIDLKIHHAYLTTSCTDQLWLQSLLTDTPYFLVHKAILKEIPVITV
jgi:hypothetical protein